MNRPVLDDVVVRIESLERLRRQTLWAGGALLALAVATVVGGASRTRTDRVLEAERFILRDQQGKARAYLAMKSDGTPGLSILDGRGHDAIQLRVLPDDTASIDLNAQGRTRLAATATERGSALILADPKHGSASSLYMTEDGTSGLGLRGGSRTVEAASQPDGHAGLVVTDEEGKERGRVGTLPEEVRPLGLRAMDGKGPFRHEPSPAESSQMPTRGPKPGGPRLLPGPLPPD